MTATTSSIKNITDLPAGTWNVDAAHSEIGFVARHLMVTKVRGRFEDFSAEVQIAEPFSASTVTATVQMDSVDTRSDDRDAHLKSADFFDTENFPTMTFTSTSVSEEELTGDLTIRGITKPVTFALDFTGITADPWGGTRAGFEAETTIDRKDWGLTFQVPLEGGGMLVSEKIKLALDIQLVKA